MAKPVDDDKRAAILAAIRAGGTCRGIAKEHGVSAGYVSKLAQGVAGAFDRDRPQTAAAVVARVFDAKTARTQAIEHMYADFQRFRERAWSEYTQVVSTHAGPELITTNLPPLPDQRAAMVSAAICLDKALALEKHDSGDGDEAGRTMVNDLFGALRLAHHRIVADAAPDAPAPDAGAAA